MLTRTRAVQKVSRQPSSRKALSPKALSSKALQKVLPQLVFAPHVKGKGRGKPRITPFDKPKTTKIGATVGVQLVNFAFEDVGGTSHLLPGFPNTVTVGLKWPKNATLAAIFMIAFSAEYVDTSGNLVDHHLGQLSVHLGFADSNNVGCTFLLRDSSTSEGVNMTANGVVLYFAS
jgi:hypothetical protein